MRTEYSGSGHLNFITLHNYYLSVSQAVQALHHALPGLQLRRSQHSLAEHLLTSAGKEALTSPALLPENHLL